MMVRRQRTFGTTCGRGATSGSSATPRQKRGDFSDDGRPAVSSSAWSHHFVVSHPSRTSEEARRVPLLVVLESAISRSFVNVSSLVCVSGLVYLGCTCQ
mmetsp:Transcript_12331/g.49660  ORF Transcript_12331/g.49660 Transcript_12331/m.49660 type:complete len:99 (-) Transcript_12331:830-1126(-)